MSDIELQEGISPQPHAVKDNIELITESPGKQEIHAQQKKYIAVLLSLFFVQGIPLGFCTALQLMLAKRGASMSQQALLTFAQYPYSFKILAAPILDSLYSDRVGKRRTYILPCQYLIGFTYVAIGLISLQQRIEGLDVGFLTGLAFFMVLISAIQDIAVDGWVLTCLTKEYVHLGSPCQSIGQVLGIMFGSVLFINLTSVAFRQDVTSNPNTNDPFLTTDQYCDAIGALILFMTLTIHLVTNEAPQKRARDEGKNVCLIIWQVLKELGQLFKNRNINVLVIFLLLQNLAVAPVSASTGIILVQEGFPNEVISQLSVYCYPFTAVTACLVGKYLSRGQESWWMFGSQLLSVIDSVLQYLLIVSLGYLGGYNPTSFWILVVITIYDQIVQTIMFCCIGGFFMRISDANIGGSYLTMLASASNLGGTASNSIGLFLLEYFPYTPTVIVFWVLGIAFLIIIRKPLLQLQSAPLNSWKLSNENQST